MVGIANGGGGGDPLSLLLSRDGIADPVGFAPYDIQLPGIDDPEALARWEPWVRAYVAQGEALEGLLFSEIKPTGTDFGGARLACLRIDVDTAGDRTLNELPVASLMRPGPAVFRAQVAQVLSWADLREERLPEIMAQLTPQYPFWGSVIYLHPSRTPWTLELLNQVFLFAVNIEMRFKHALACWRPIEYSSQIQPVITTPGHGSLPSGHATQAYIVTHVLQRLLGLQPDWQASVQLERLAARIAINRTVAGVHFPVDSIAGRLLGKTLGEFFVSRCTGDTADCWQSRTFNGDLIPGNTAFEPWSKEQSLDRGTASNLIYTTEAESNRGTQSKVLTFLWEKAKKEWGNENYRSGPTKEMVPELPAPPVAGGGATQGATS